MKSTLRPIPLLLVVLVTLFQTAAPQLSSQQLSLGSSVHIDLDPDLQNTWILTLPSQLDSTLDLFITVQAPLNDPLQHPALSIKTPKDEIQRCDIANSQFAGICRIDRTLLKPDLSLYITAKCPKSCGFTITATLQSRLKLQLGNSLTIKSPEITAKEYQFELQIPSNLEFTSLAMYAQINDFPEANGGLMFYANVGNKDTPVPTEQKHDITGQSIFWGGEGLYFSKQLFSSTNNWIKIYLAMPPGTEVKLFSKLSKDNSFTVELEETYFNYVTADRPNNIYLNLTNQKDKIKDDTLSLEFVVYAGDPDISVAFDQNFDNQLIGKRNFGALTYLIPSSLRKGPNYQDAIFIKVSSKGNADFSFHSVLHQRSQVSLASGVSYYNQLLKGKMFNYFFDDFLYLQKDDSNTKRSYSLQMDLIKGNGKFGVRRCIQAEKGASVTSCVIQDISALSDQKVNKQFKQISTITKNSSQFYQITIEYDLSQCQLLKAASIKGQTYYCSFHVYASNQNEDKFAYSLKMSKNTDSTLLKEGHTHRSTVFKGQSLYYHFGLTSLEEIKEVIFFTTTFEGDTTILASTSNPFPDCDILGDLKSGHSNRIIYQKDQLSNHFYLAVQGHQYSQFSIGVVINRHLQTPDSSQASSQPPGLMLLKTKIQLQLGLNLEYVLKSNEQEALFEIVPYESNQIKIQVSEIVGNIRLQVKKSDGSKIDCQEESISSTSVVCSLNAISEETISLVVSGKLGLEQKFVITYHNSQSCVPYSLNKPLYKSLKAGSSECIEYTISKKADLVLATSISIAHLLKNNVQLKLCVNGKCLKKTLSHHQQVSKELLQVLCQFHQKSRSACLISLSLSNTSPSNLQFYVVLREQNFDVALLDGITQKVISPHLSSAKPRNFCYEVSDTSTIKIFFTSFTPNQFCILGKFVSRKDFLSSPQSAYVNYQNRYLIEESNEQNYIQFVKHGEGSNIFSISTEKVKRNCLNCILTLSVYSLSKHTDRILSAFQIEVSQKETVIKVGQAKIGYLEENQFLVHQLQQPSAGDAVVSVKDLNQQSSIQKPCFEISLKGINNLSSQSILVVEKESPDLKLYIKAIKDVCAFQITYTHLSNPITAVIKNNAYLFEIKDSSATYFIYSHNFQESFKVVQVLSSGESKISVAPIPLNLKFQDIQLDNLDTFTYRGDESQGQLLISADSQHFCSSCNYVIAISSKNGVKGQLHVISQRGRVPLSTNGLLKQKIKVDDVKVRNYTFNSVSNFNISLNVIYGKIVVTVFGPDGKIRSKQTVLGSAILKIMHDGEDDQQTFEYLPSANNFSINVQADIDSYYTIKASKRSIFDRIFEGVTSYLPLLQQKPVLLQYFNGGSHDKAKGNKKTLSVLIEYIWKFSKIIGNPKIEAKAYHAGTDAGNLKPIEQISRVDSQSSISIELPWTEGDIFLNISSDHEVFITLLLAKQSLIHAKPEANLLMTKPSTFQIYSPNKSVLVEVFICSGSLDIEASDRYLDFTSGDKSEKQVALSQNNYGGHFVMNSQQINGEYYVKVNSKEAGQSPEMAYILNYYYYNKGDILPYHLIEQVSSQITYTRDANTIRFIIQPILVKDLQQSPIRSFSVRYQFYFSNNKKKLSSFSNCRLDNVIIRTASSTSQNTIQYTFQTNELESLDQTYFAGAEAIVSLSLDASKSDHYPKELNILYNAVEVSQQSTKNLSVTTIILFMALPFLAAAITLYVLVRLCIWKYRGMVPSNLAEQPELQGKGESAEVINSAVVTSNVVKESAGPLQQNGDTL